MNIDNVADWFDWVDAGGTDVDLSLRLDALNRIIERLIVLKVAFQFYGYGWHFNRWKNMRKVALAWRRMYSVLRGMLDRDLSIRVEHILLHQKKREEFVESELIYGRRAIRVFVPECVMLVAPEKSWEEEEVLVS